jgi:hypothetical protein
MGLPMILWSIINIYNRKHILTSYMLIALFPFYSLIQFSSPFIIFYLVLFLLYDCYNKKKINYDLVYPILIIFGAAIIANFNIISTLFLDNAEKSHRCDERFTKIGVRDSPQRPRRFLQSVFFGYRGRSSPPFEL